MAVTELHDLVDPAHTVLCVVECQNGVIGAEASLPKLAEAAADIVPTLAALAVAARSAGVKVVHATAQVFPDRWGANDNARLFGVARRSAVQLVAGSAAAEPIPELGYDPSNDVLVPRSHGLSPFSGTELEHLLRNEGITTVVLAGVSLNVAIPNAAFDLVNGGFQAVVATDCVVATPSEYGDQVLANTLSYVATLADSSELTASW
ncbi:MAG: isochorismatase family protein [Actinomycetota bacterium]|nr:isochorismatase family protein [Actinomycetota bacterium]